MGQRQEDATQPAVRVAEDSELSEDSRSVVGDALASELVLAVERVHITQRKFNPVASPWEPTPRPGVGSADDDLQSLVETGETICYI